jgi:hypothetical protein
VNTVPETYSPRTIFKKTSFSFKLTKGHKKLVCFITLGRKALQVTNALAYWADL